MDLRALFALRGALDKTSSLIIGVGGFIILVAVWQLICGFGLVPPALLPAPLSVLKAFIELHFEDALVRNALYSIRLNLLGYIEAIAVSIPLGLAMGLVPLIRSATDAYIKAFRFVPLAAATGLFIAWFGIMDNMKVQFLAVSIIVYLLPVVIQRIDEVPEVYLQTAHTLGATSWQKVFTVYVPSVLSRISDDVRVLVAISWTYITIAEALNMTGGIGALCVQCARKSRIDKVFAVLLLIVIIGFLQDKLFSWLDRMLFKFKYS
jgi:NitT/TauT family transport system permease protein